MVRIALFASGSGTNVENIVNYFENSEKVEIVAVLCNKPDAFVLQRAKKFNIKTLVFSKLDLNKENKVLSFLQSEKIDFIVLAGFLWLIPQKIVKEYPQKIINIHPALLPKYGGKGMFGMHVHEAVIAAGEKESGITIHYVNENYDEGTNILQAKVLVDKGDTAETLAEKIHQLEYLYFPKTIEQLTNKMEQS